MRDAFLQDRIHVSVAVLHRKPLPIVGLVALGHVLRDGELGMAFDGEAVVVRERDELSQAEVPGIGARR